MIYLDSIHLIINIIYNDIFVYGIAAIKELNSVIKNQQITINSLQEYINRLENN